MRMPNVGKYKVNEITSERESLAINRHDLDFLEEKIITNNHLVILLSPNILCNWN